MEEKEVSVPVPLSVLRTVHRVITALIESAETPGQPSQAERMLSQWRETGDAHRMFQTAVGLSTDPVQDVLSFSDGSVIVIPQEGQAYARDR